MSDQHTPGPWLYIRGDEWSNSVVTQHDDLPDGRTNYWTVASINKQREPEHEANARLIAAAPDLLKQLQHVVHFFDQLNPSDIERYSAAIAKATGSAT